MQILQPILRANQNTTWTSVCNTRHGCDTTCTLEGSCRPPSTHVVQPQVQFIVGQLSFGELCSLAISLVRICHDNVLIVPIILHFQGSKDGIIKSIINTDHGQGNGAATVGFQWTRYCWFPRRVAIQHVHELSFLHRPNHNGAAFWIAGHILSRDDTPTTRLAKIGAVQNSQGAVFVFEFQHRHRPTVRPNYGDIFLLARISQHRTRT
mmetsp:Transcript_24482/g.67790  ORF Transcript_24482/g.67790 Transcript_24482/m.67790 type:complete len:208 (+) Transcript_24482:3231-3854(+)